MLNEFLFLSGRRKPLLFLMVLRRMVKILRLCSLESNVMTVEEWDPWLVALGLLNFTQVSGYKYRIRTKVLLCLLQIKEYNGFSRLEWILITIELSKAVFGIFELHIFLKLPTFLVIYQYLLSSAQKCTQTLLKSKIHSEPKGVKHVSEILLKCFQNPTRLPLVLNAPI